MTIAGHQITGSLRPVGEEEIKTRVEQAGRDNTAAFEDKFGFGAEQECADFEEPRGSGQADGDEPGGAESAQEVAIGEWVGRGEVDDAGELFVRDEEVDGVDEIGVVNPGDELGAWTLSASESEA